MKILQTPVRFHPFIGGVENYVHSLSRELVELGHDVTVLCANEPESKKEDLIDGIRVLRLSYMGKIANTNITPSLPLKIMREKFDLVHTHLPTPWSADVSGLAAALKGKPLVLTYYNDIVAEGRARQIARLYNGTCLKLLLRRASKIIVIQPDYVDSSPHLREFRDKIETIPVGVDLSRFRPTHEATDGETLFFLSCLDRYHSYKGLDDLLEALVLVKEDYPEVKLLVGGSGELLDHYRGMTRDLCLEDNVEFLGFIPEDMLAKRYNRSDVFVLPSNSRSQEGFGMVALEAMACGKPVICTDIVGLAEDIEKRGAGLTVEPSNPKRLAVSIIHILKKGPELKEMGCAGRRLAVEKYGWRTVAERVEGVYYGQI
ncbi:glycosyltransferase family 4 protein [Candidatus Methanocrinis natronophilus]|uniref:Glycosyltransferase family 4 protein n=1 Tax=Candidatus Methanocrinis natronophilus TaxID=3033396 RepID=A0ABT5XB74_9EURY|nr:glycosyltransferase family 4 protein [Candidatus Methanocrinis natronophilus]MDF0591964.1 glycosyltransferase family 4 protein [Candidatus Methanocrinis natronophilus]